MADKKEVLEELYRVTSKISSQVWVLNPRHLGHDLDAADFRFIGCR
jgi:hypothetical protein